MIRPIHSPTLAGEVRGSDGFGSGAWAASRDGGRRKHVGLDFLAEPTEDIISPCDGVVTRIGKAYPEPQKSEYTLVEIANGPFLIRVMYVLAAVAAGDLVKVGQVIGHAQNVAKAYGPKMKNHVHMDIRVIGGNAIVEGERSNQDVFVNPADVIEW